MTLLHIGHWMSVGRQGANECVRYCPLELAACDSNGGKLCTDCVSYRPIAPHSLLYVFRHTSIDDAVTLAFHSSISIT